MKQLIVLAVAICTSTAPSIAQGRYDIHGAGVT